MGEDEKNKYSKPFSHPRWHEPIGGEVNTILALVQDEEEIYPREDSANKEDKSLG